MALVPKAAILRGSGSEASILRPELFLPLAILHLSCPRAPSLLIVTISNIPLVQFAVSQP